MTLIRQTASLIVVVQAWIILIRKIIVRRNVYPLVSYGPMLARDQERIANLNHIYNTTDLEAVQMLQMGRGPFYELVKRFKDGGLLKDSIHTSVEEQVCMFLHVVGHNQRFKVIHNTFRRSCETISRYFKQVLFAIGELRHEMIKPPSGQTPPKIKNSFRWFPYFKVTVHSLLYGSNISTTMYDTMFSVCSSHCRIALVPSMVLM